LILFTLVVAGVKLDVPLKIEPLGIPLVVQRPDLLSIGLVIAATYSTLRYVYYGMLIQPSPMRARRELMLGARYVPGSGGLEEELDKARADFQGKVDRWFPQIGKHKVTFEAILGTAALMENVKVPRLVRLLGWIEDFDFLLPITANVMAVGFWIVSRYWSA
jgi:hypothetical protein